MALEEKIANVDEKSGRSVLIVEYDKGMRKLNQQIFKRYLPDVSASYVSTKSEAIELMKKRRYNGIVNTIDERGIEKDEVCRFLEENDPSMNDRVLYVGVFLGKVHNTKYRCMPKPFDVEVYVSKIRGLIEDGK